MEKVMNFENFLTKTQKTELMSSNRSSFASALSRKLSRLTSKNSYISGVNSPKIQAIRPNQQYLEVPQNPLLGNSLATRMDFILRKRTRLLERQKTKKNIRLQFTFGNQEEDLFT
jgi:hypothetical protein